jgi:Ca2+-binding RTX toxin-like protein
VPVTSEPLEGRRLFDSASMNGSVLEVFGDFSADQIDVYLIHGSLSDNIYVAFEGDTLNPAGPFNQNSVSRIDVFADGGDDVVTIETDSAWNFGNGQGVNENTRIYCNSGNDRVNGGDFADEIFGELGNDTLDGRGGDDSMYGGYAGNDTADTSGNDTLTGGAGADLMYGGPGDDVFHASDGEIDTIDGGPGTDNANDRDFLSPTDSVINV